MQLDKSFAALGSDLDQWFEENSATFTSLDRMAQWGALRAGIEIQKKLDSLKAEGLAAMASLIKRSDVVPNGERTASFIQAFEFGAKLSATLYDELLDVDGFNKTVRLMNQIAKTLDAQEPGRSVLSVLLEHPDIRVRASAGTYLVDLMPEQVVPVLRKIDERQGGKSADFTAHWALLDWELKQKAGTK
jgi:hypothetical protein